MGFLNNLKRVTADKVNEVANSINDGSAAAKLQHYVTKTTEQVSSMATDAQKRSQEALERHPTMKNAADAFNKVTFGAANIFQNAGINENMSTSEMATRFGVELFKQSNNGQMNRQMNADMLQNPMQNSSPMPQMEQNQVNNQSVAISYDIDE